MATIQNIKGKRFGKLVVKTLEGRNKWGAITWKCRCDCGSEPVVAGCAMKSGHVKSCGCLHKESVSKASTKHGFSRTPIYLCWGGMIQRCTNPNALSYKRYGGRGITVCKRWLKFENFLADMGERPKGYSLDRIDNNGNYHPNNCRWATREQQANNTSSVVLLEFDGKVQSIARWAREYGLPEITLRHRIQVWGWSISRALLTDTYGRPW